MDKRENMSVTITEYDGKERHRSVQEVAWSCDGGQEKNAVNLHPFLKYQTIEGFGSTFNEAAAYVFAQMTEPSKKAFLDACFGEEGLLYNQTRMSMDSCDASRSNYSAMDDESDTQMKSFSLKRDEEYILPFYRAVTEYRKEPVCAMLSPWSPPAFMKTNGEKNHGGQLKPEYRQMWAEYFCRFVEGYLAAGVDVKRISIQNEPNAVQVWDSCCYNGAEEKAFLRDYLYPALRAHGLDHLELYIWDHNKERMLERAMEVIDDETDAMVDGIGFHWYSGDHFEALQMVRELYPDKKVAFTEGCVEYSILSADNHLANARMYGHDMIGNINGGASFLTNWTILYDSQGGPNHVNNWCEAPIMYDEKSDTLDVKLSYEYIWHISHFITPGSVRIGFSRFTDEIDVTAAQRPDGKIAAVLMNRTGTSKEIFLRMEGQVAKLVLPGDSIATALI